MLTLKEFTDTIDGLEEARILVVSLEFKIYTVLCQKCMTAKQIARATKANACGMTALLNALVAMKALGYKDGKYSSAPQMYKYFCESSPHYLKGTTYLKTENNDEWVRLVNVIRKGRGVSGFDKSDNSSHRDCFTHAMHERSGPFAKKIAGIITQKPVGRLLDLGCGPGTYSAAILKMDKKASATLVDRPAALKVAQKLHGDASLWKRVKRIKGDLFSTSYGDSHDTVFYSNILHIYNPSQNKELFRKIKKAMVKGGRFILVDYFHTKDATQPYEAALFGVTMQMFTETGKTYSYDETEKMLSQTGFHKIRRQSLGEGAGMMTAFKK